MEPLIVWRGVVHDGRVVFDRPQDLRRYLSTLSEARVEVVGRRQRAQRSLPQNAWLWMANALIADALGYDRHEVEALHYALLGKRFGVRTDGPTGLSLPVRTSSQLTTAEMSDYMEWLVRFAASELGVVVPLPGEVEVVT